MTRSLEKHSITWQGILIEIRYEARWLGTTGPFSTAHLEVETLVPERAPLPITETGYRSHFTNADDIAADGGPIAFVIAWLDHAAQSQAWKDQTEKARQLTLF